MVNRWAYPVRIFSDLHLGHPLSVVREAAGLGPLAEGAGTVLLNGDTFEPHLERARGTAATWRAELDRVVTAAGAGIVYLSGNHDPEASPLDHADLGGGQVFVTHGDVLFERLTPWSLDAEFLARARASSLGRHPLARRDDVGPHLQAAREAAAEGHARRRRRKSGSLVRVLSWMPAKFWYVFQAWRTAPTLGRRFLQQFRPDTRFLVYGHIHRAGVARRGRRVLINTGAFQWGCRRLCVEVDAAGVRVRPVVGRGVFRLADPTHDFAWSSHPPLERTAAAERT